MGKKENLKLWESVSRTNPKDTKPVSVGGRDFTSVNPQSQRKQATEAFGPFGIGWGVEDADISFQSMGEDTILCMFIGTLWYELDGKRGSFPITSAVKAMYRTNGGKGYLKVDDDCTKKVATNALTKGLSFLGFNADVFEGMFDDDLYVDAAGKVIDAENSLKPISNNDKTLIDQLIVDVDANEEDFLSHFKINSTGEMNYEQFSTALVLLKAKKSHAGSKGGAA